jgi:hypothetical protein
MTTRLVSLDRLREIARNAQARVAVDGVRRVAYLRLGQTRYVAPLEDAA